MKQRAKGDRSQQKGYPVEPSRSRSRIRSWTLLYRPIRHRAWLYRAPFYFLSFVAVPFIAVAALGAYVGPDKSFGGLPVLLVMLLFAYFVRKLAIRADASLNTSHSAVDGHLLIENWPFPLEPPPPRRLVLGYILSAAGTALIAIGFLGGGIAANGILWPILLFLNVHIDGLVTPPVPLTIIFAISAVILGTVISIVGLGSGPRLRDRGRRLRAQDARLLIQKVGERPVLLLRSFEDEELVDPRPLNLFQQRYEETLSRALKQIGPVITIGRPGDDLGFSGAARFYVSDENWQQAIRYLMMESAVVVIVVGRTGGLWWEIGTALECVLRKRLLFFVPLIDKKKVERSWFKSAAEFTKRWNLTRARYRQMEAERQARYQAFRERSAEYLGEALPASLDNAYFFDFLSNDQVRILNSRYGFMRNFMIDFSKRNRRARFDMNRTLRPFMAKIYDITD